MKKLCRFLVLAAAVASLGAVVICNNILQLADPNVFDLDQFEANIMAAFEGNTLGYAMNSNGTLLRSGANGVGRTSIDGQKNMSIHDRMHVASISKNITTAADLKPPANGPNLFYTFPDDGTRAVGGSSDFTLTAGGFGWNLSVYQLAAYLACLRFSNDIINAQSRAVMDGDELGWWNTRQGIFGTYLAETGGWKHETSPRTKGLRACMMDYPNGIQIAVIVNSRDDEGLDPMNKAGTSEDAFDQAHGL